MPTNDPKYMKEYQRKRRQKTNTDDLPAADDSPHDHPRRADLDTGDRIVDPETGEVYELGWEVHRRDLMVTEPEVIQATDIASDRERGLPRSNYYGDWVPTIQRMSPHAIQKILDHPSVKTASREKK